MRRRSSKRRVPPVQAPPAGGPAVQTPAVPVLPSWRRMAAAALLIAAVALALFLPGLDQPSGYVFDEIAYVPAARALLQGDSGLNREHPPLAKYLVAGGMALVGDTPVGWRVASVAFGAMTVVALFFAAIFAFASPSPESPRAGSDRLLVAAIGAATLGLLSQMIFVQARVAMIDTSATGFMATGLAAFAAAAMQASQRAKTTLLYVAGALLGAATACKWSGALALIVAWILLSVSPKQFAEMPWKKRLLALGATPLLVYVAAFAPFLWMTPATGPGDLWDLHAAMMRGQMAHAAFHAYASEWWQWPLLLRPIWYAFEPDATRANAHVVFLVGNPVVLWSGLAAIGWAAVRIVRRRGDFGERLVAVSWTVFLFTWALAPRPTMFFYYYYPASLSLCLALPLVWLRYATRQRAVAMHLAAGLVLATSLGAFVFFYPVVSGASVSAREYAKWVWMDSWALSTRRSAEDREGAALQVQPKAAAAGN